jgi:hypothetical protein
MLKSWVQISNATTRDDLAIPLDEAPGIIGLLKGKITVSDDFIERIFRGVGSA